MTIADEGVSGTPLQTQLIALGGGEIGTEPVWEPERIKGRLQILELLECDPRRRTGRRNRRATLDPIRQAVIVFKYGIQS